MKEATQNYHVTHIRLTNRTLKKVYMERNKKMVKPMGGAITKYFFPSVESRLAVNLNLIPNVTTIMTAMEIFDLTCID